MTHEQQVLLLYYVSMAGMVAFNVFLVFLAYWKLLAYYPMWVKKHRWVFAVVAALLSFLMLFIFNKFYIQNQFGVSSPENAPKPHLPKF